MIWKLNADCVEAKPKTPTGNYFTFSESGVERPISQ